MILQTSKDIIYNFINRSNYIRDYEMPWNETKNFNKHLNSAISMYKKGSSLLNIVNHFNMLQGNIKYNFNKKGVSIITDEQYRVISNKK